MGYEEIQTGHPFFGEQVLNLLSYADFFTESLKNALNEWHMKKLLTLNVITSAYSCMDNVSKLLTWIGTLEKIIMGLG